MAHCAASNASSLRQNVSDDDDVVIIHCESAKVGSKLDETDVKPVKRAKPNHEYCDSCREGGELICCDTCPASFHLECHDPPVMDVPKGNWYCNMCVFRIRRKKNLKTLEKPMNFFEKMAYDVEGSNAKEFELPKFLIESKKGRKNVGRKRSSVCCCCLSGSQKEDLVRCESDYCSYFYHASCWSPPVTAVSEHVGLLCPNHVENELIPKLKTCAISEIPKKIKEIVSSDKSDFNIMHEYFSSLRKCSQQRGTSSTKRNITKIVPLIDPAVQNHYKKFLHATVTSPSSDEEIDEVEKSDENASYHEINFIDLQKQFQHQIALAAKRAGFLNTESEKSFECFKCKKISKYPPILQCHKCLRRYHAICMNVQNPTDEWKCIAHKWACINSCKHLLQPPKPPLSEFISQIFEKDSESSTCHSRRFQTKNENESKIPQPQAKSANCKNIVTRSMSEFTKCESLSGESDHSNGNSERTLLKMVKNSFKMFENTNQHSESKTLKQLEDEKCHFESMLCYVRDLKNVPVELALLDGLQTKEHMDVLETTKQLDVLQTTKPVDVLQTTMPVDVLQITKPVDVLHSRQDLYEQGINVNVVRTDEHEKSSVLITEEVPQDNKLQEEYVEKLVDTDIKSLELKETRLEFSNSNTDISIEHESEHLNMSEIAKNPSETRNIQDQVFLNMLKCFLQQKVSKGSTGDNNVDDSDSGQAKLQNVKVEVLEEPSAHEDEKEKCRNEDIEFEGNSYVPNNDESDLLTTTDTLSIGKEEEHLEQMFLDIEEIILKLIQDLDGKIKSLIEKSTKVNKPKPDPTIAFLHPMSGTNTSVPIRKKNVTLGIGPESDIDLSKYGFCEYASRKHAVIYFDRKYELFVLLNYSDYGTLVDDKLCCLKGSVDKSKTAEDAKESETLKCKCTNTLSKMYKAREIAHETISVLDDKSKIQIGCLHFSFHISEGLKVKNRKELLNTAAKELEIKPSANPPNKRKRDQIIRSSKALYGKSNESLGNEEPKDQDIGNVSERKEMRAFTPMPCPMMSLELQKQLKLFIMQRSNREQRHLQFFHNLYPGTKAADELVKQNAIIRKPVTFRRRTISQETFMKLKCHIMKKREQKKIAQCVLVKTEDVNTADSALNGST